MNLKTILRGGGASALVAAVALVALPSVASARPDHDGARERPERQQPAARSQGAGNWVQRSVQRAQAPQQRQQAAPQQQWRPQAAQQQRAQQSWNRGDNRSPTAQERSGRDWNRGDNRSTTAQQRSGRDWNRGDRTWGQTRQAPVQQTQSRGDWVQRSVERNRTYRDNDRNTTYRDRQRTENWRQGDNWRDRDNRGDWRDRDHDRDGWHDRDGHRWNREWRNNNQYNWYSYRNQYRDRYRLGRYYAPYRGYNYSRLSIGFYLDNVFFGSRYWINDPGYYRLPPAYGGLRWVRYYDDALLVDTYTGEVVDVIYDFFW